MPPISRGHDFIRRRGVGMDRAAGRCFRLVETAEASLWAPVGGRGRSFLQPLILESGPHEEGPLSRRGECPLVPAHERFNL